MKEGYVYVLSNESMPGIVKIGRSKHSGRKRADEIYRGATGVPTPFKMEFEIFAGDCHESEILVHEELGHRRISQDREFFKVEIEEAVEVMMRVIGYDYNLTTGQADSTINEGELVPAYGFEQQKLLKELFPSVPIEIVLASAVRDYLSNEAVADAIRKYHYSFEERRAKLKSNKEAPILEVVSE